MAERVEPESRVDGIYFKIRGIGRVSSKESLEFELLIPVLDVRDERREERKCHFGVPAIKLVALQSFFDSRVQNLCLS